jgi:hypothetical protein
VPGATEPPDEYLDKILVVAPQEREESWSQTILGEDGVCNFACGDGGGGPGEGACALDLWA